MKILVTGGAGFIGSAVVRLAVARGHQVVNLDALTYAACLDNVADVAGNPNYAFEQADIRDRAALDAVFDQALAAREASLLATVPVLLGKRFAQLYEAHRREREAAPDVAGQAATAGAAATATAIARGSFATPPRVSPTPERTR